MKRILILAFGIVLFGVGMAFSDDPSSFWLRALIGTVAVGCVGLGFAYYSRHTEHFGTEVSMKRRLILALGAVLFGAIMALRNDVSGLWLRAGIGGLAGALVCLIWMYAPKDECRAE